MIRNEAASTLSLNGTWDFSLGEQITWQSIRVPGCWEAQGYSKWIEGPARYRRRFIAPGDWSGLRIFLEFDAVSYACTVWLNGAQVATHQGMWTPFAVDVTGQIRPGEENTLELEVYKPWEKYPLRSSLAGFLPDVATPFGGIWQPVRLRALPAGLDDLLLDPNPETGDVRVRCRPVVFNGEDAGGLQVTLVQAGRTVASQKFAVLPGQPVDVTLSLPETPELWSPDHPALYEVRLALLDGEQTLAEASQQVGFRRLESAGDQLLFNGRPVCLRGALSWGWEPELIAPAFSEEQIRAEFRRVASLGFNMVKLCLFVPNQLYFDLADQEGIFLWQEWPLWLPKITGELRATAPAEYAEYMRLARHHPSVVLYSVGCELNLEVDAGFLSQLNDTVRGLISDVLVCDNSGSGEAFGGLHLDFADFNDYHTYTDLHYFEPMMDHWRRDWRAPRPWIFGEFTDSDTFRDVGEIIAHNDGQKPWWMTEDVWVHTWRPEVAALLAEQELLAQAELAFTPRQLTEISYAQSLVVRKYILEAVRRRAGMGGYVITGLRDTPIFTSGLFDDFDRPKWTGEQFRSFNDEAVLCLDTDRIRRWQHRTERVERLDPFNRWAGEQARYYLILNTTGSLSEGERTLTWRLVGIEGQAVAGGEARISQSVLPGRPQQIATIEFELPAGEEAAREYRLEARLAGPGGEISNSWPVWAYPRPGAWPEDFALDDPAYVLEEAAELLPARRWEEGGRQDLTPAVVVTTHLRPRLRDYLAAGGRVLLLQQGDGPLPARRSAFWREAIKLFPSHPLWERFPQRGYTDLQFFGLASDVLLDLARLGEVVPEATNVRPVMRRLDAREFWVGDYLVEAQVGGGRLLACTLRLQGGEGAQPTGLAQNVAGYFLLWEMVKYLYRV